MNNNKRNQFMKIGVNLVFILLIMGSAMVFFDENDQNDDLGWVLLIIFWALRSVEGLRKNVKEGNNYGGRWHTGCSDCRAFMLDGDLVLDMIFTMDRYLNGGM